MGEQAGGGRARGPPRGPLVCRPPQPVAHIYAAVAVASSTSEDVNLGLEEGKDLLILAGGLEECDQLREELRDKRATVKSLAEKADDITADTSSTQELFRIESQEKESLEHLPLRCSDGRAPKRSLPTAYPLYFENFPPNHTALNIQNCGHEIISSA